jgi:hypothetical protein
MLKSTPFGEFDPLHPCTVPGLFAENLYAEPVVIDAPIERVWEIIIDFDRYPEWNPLNRFFRLDTRAEVGQTVTFGPSWGPYHEATLPDADFTQCETLTVWEENCCLAYAVISYCFNAERAQHISPLDAGRTRYQTYERMSGIIKPFVRRLYGARIVAGFTANGIALKQRAEARTKSS